MLKKTVLVAIVVAFSLWGGAALATHSDPDVVHLCLQPSGKVKVVDDSNNCTAPSSVVDVSSAAAVSALDARLSALESLLDGVAKAPVGGALIFPSGIQASSLSALGDIIAGDDLRAIDNVQAGDDVIADTDGDFDGDLFGENVFATQSVQGSHISSTGDVVAGDDLRAIDNVQAGDDVIADTDGDFDGDLFGENVFATQSVQGSHISSTGDVVAGDDLNANDNVTADADGNGTGDLIDASP